MLTCGCLTQMGLDIYNSPEMFISESKSLMLYMGAKNQTPGPYSFVIYIITCFLPGQHTLQAR